MGVTIKEGTELERFVRLVEAAKTTVPVLSDASPDVLLCREPPSDDLQFKEDIARLQSPLSVACVVGVIPERTLHILDAISGSLTKHTKCYVLFSNEKAWIGAIRWAMPRAHRSNAALAGISQHHRGFHVGRACQRLSDRGFQIDIDTTGPLLEKEDLKAIAEHVSDEISRFGGTRFLQSICSYVKDRGMLHDGLWLLGNQVGNYKDALPPALPIGMAVFGSRKTYTSQR